MVLTKFTLSLSNHARKYLSKQVEAWGIPKQCLIQNLIIFNSGEYYVKNIFQITFCRLSRQRMSLLDVVYITLEMSRVMINRGLRVLKPYISQQWKFFKIRIYIDSNKTENRRKGKLFFAVECQLINLNRLTEKYHTAAIIVINNSDKCHHWLNRQWMFGGWGRHGIFMDSKYFIRLIL